MNLLTLQRKAINGMVIFKLRSQQTLQVPNEVQCDRNSQLHFQVCKWIGNNRYVEFEVKRLKTKDFCGAICHFLLFVTDS